MTFPEPFTYPTMPHQRRHGPSGYRDYRDYKPWLRDEFTFRCVYCLERELWYPDRAASFSVEHVVPQSEDPTRICDYDNHLYACTRCNSARKCAPVLDPTQVAYGNYLHVKEDGTVTSPHPEGQEFIALFHLNEAPAMRVRKNYLRILRLKKQYPTDAEIHECFQEAFGFPEDLPDLSRLNPPGGNNRPNGLADCYFHRKCHGELPQTY